MTRRVAKRQLRRGLSLREEPMPEEQPMEYEDEEDDLADLLDEEPPVEEEEEPDDDMMLAELGNVYKALDERDDMILQLAKGVQKLSKRIMALESDEDESEEDKEDKAAPRMEQKEAPEGDFTVGGDDDMGEEIQGGGEAQTPGLTAGQPQGIAQKAKIANALEAAGVSSDLIAKATGLIKKDDKWSNFGDKDSDIPANAPVTPDTKDWDEAFGIVPGSGNAPASVKGIGSVAKALEGLGIERSAIDKLFEGKGFIRKAQPPTVGAGATGETPSIDKLEEQARSLNFHQLNQWRQETGDL
ncbi:hypothetical protein LCGC14_1524390 [marine sediment metagenome]|uniref:Uncharacterized protein n=1 Tax=marine sediment metagenome TaxID=412755 RepID=A0A0F9LYN1_9ZZZZ